MRHELDARALNSKGLKSQLVARLTKALKTEQEQEEAGVRAAEQAAAEKAAKAEESSADAPAEEGSDKKVKSTKQQPLTFRAMTRACLVILCD
jgi:hypothetical protein